MAAKKNGTKAKGGNRHALNIDVAALRAAEAEALKAVREKFLAPARDRKAELEKQRAEIDAELRKINALLGVRKGGGNGNDDRQATDEEIAKAISFLTKRGDWVTTDEVAKEVGYSKPAKLLASAIQEGEVERSGMGRGTKFRVKGGK